MILASFEPMTRDFLAIAVELLVRHFGHDRETAVALIGQWLTREPSKLREDFIHHEMPWRVAACVHYLESVKGPRERLGHWLMESGNQSYVRDRLQALRSG